ncbi:MAG: pyridoxamine 5'-phosphate oxidase family protein [Bacteroidota bacterium]
MSSYPKQKRNKVVRGAKRATYDKEAINKILDAGFIGFVGYIYEQTAISIPMAYSRIGDKIYLHGSLKNRMLRAALGADQMSMTVMHLDALVLARSGLHHSVNYRSATLFGSLKVVENHNKKVEILESIINFMVPDRWDSLRPITEKEINSTLVVEMKIENASAKIRDVGVQDEKRDYQTDVWAGLIPVKQVFDKPVRDPLLPDHVKTPEHILNYLNRNYYD